MLGQVRPGGLLQEKLAVLTGGRVLDVATGSGSFAKALAEGMKDCTEVVGIDMDEKVLETAREMKLENVRFEVMDAGDLKFEDEAFDTVAISNSLHHMKSPGTVLSGMKRVLRTGGLFVVREMFRDGLDRHQMTHFLFHSFRSDIDTLKGVTHRKSYLRIELLHMYGGLGLYDLDVFDVGPGDIEPKIDPMDKDNIDHMVKMVDTMLAHPADYNHDQRFKVRGMELKEYIRENGFLPATSLVAIGRKPG